MIIKIGLLVTASIAVYAIQQITIKRWRTPRKSSGILDLFSNLSDIEEDSSEFESMLSSEIDDPLPSDKFENMEKGDRDYEIEMANNATELERLRSLVQELQEREAKLEGELLEYYSFRDQESEIIELRKQAKIKSVEIDMLNSTINILQAERKKLRAEVAQGASARKELAIARSKIQEMQRQIQVDANQTKVQLLLLKQQVLSLQVKEEEAMKNDSELEKKIKAVNELEMEVVELKRINKEIQHEKREMVVKMESAEAKIKSFSNISQNDMKETNSLRLANEELQKQVEELQMNRFSEVEELVYLRWVNACLRYELGNYPTNTGKISARDLSKTLSPRSQVKAKQLMLEYAGSEPGQVDTDLSHRSSSFSEYSDNTSIDSPMSKYSGHSKNGGLIQKLKKWGKSKDDSSILPSPVRSDGGGFSRRTSLSVRRRGPLKALMLMDADESVGFTENEKRAREVPRPSSLNGPQNQGDFAKFLATEVREASFENMDDLGAFVNWLDEELHCLVDERAVLKHLDWPDSKADALREAAFECQDLVKLDKLVTSFVDDPSLPCEIALKKMSNLLEKVERGICPLLRTRDAVISRYKEFGIPVDWLQDSCLVGKIKISSVQLAKNYMKRVASELDSLGEPDNEPNREYIALQGVRFAFRVHQFAGGFDAESMQAFEDLRSRIGVQMGEEKKQET